MAYAQKQNPPTAQSLREQLKIFVPINSLDSEGLHELTRHAQLVAFPRGAKLFNAGDSGNRILYLLSGEIELRNSDESISVSAGSEMALLPLDPHQARQYTATAISDSEVVVIERNLLDILLTWDHHAGYQVSEIEEEDDVSQDWMSTILQSKIFQKIPPVNIQAMFQKLNSMPMRSGEIVFYEGDAGEDYYFIRSGECDVIKFVNDKSMEIVAALQAGQSFGEEALLTDSKRNATIRMRTDGVLLRLAKEDFEKLFKTPVINGVDFATADTMYAQGAIWIDVRQKEEHALSRMPGSINVPLNLIRETLSAFNEEATYLLYCDTGQRSSCAAYLLNAYGYNAYIIKGGLESLVKIPTQA